MITCQPPLKGEAAHRAGGVSGGTRNPIWNAPRRIRTDPRCPLWGKCRAAAKGVPLVFLSCYHSTNDTPSVSLTLDSSPTGEPSLTAPGRGGGASRRRGQARYAEYQSECTKANPYKPLAAPFGGGAPRSGKGGVVGVFELFPFIEPHPLSLANARQLPHRGAEFKKESDK